MMLEPRRDVSLAVVDESGKPVRGASIRATGRSWREALVADEQGKVRLRGVPAGSLRVEVRRPGVLGSFEAELEAGKEELELELPAPPLLTGSFRDAASGDLVAGVTPKDNGMDCFVGIVPPEGNTVHVPKGGTEWAFNVGDKTYHEVLIELKNT